MKNLLIDGNNILYMNYFTIKDIEDEQELNNETISRFLHSLIDITFKVNNVGKIYVFFDGYPKRRKDIYPQYKDGREKQQKAKISVKEISKVVTPVLTLLGIDVYQDKHEESDDVIASFVNQHDSDINVIVSSDKDFYQLVSDRTVIYRYGIKNGGFYDVERVIRETGVEPDRFHIYKCFVSDPSDNIKGVSRLRKKVIKKLIRIGDVDDILSSPKTEQLCSKSEYEKIINASDNLRLNRKLVTMVSDINIEEYRKSSGINVKLAKKILHDNGIGSIPIAQLILDKSYFVKFGNTDPDVSIINTSGIDDL